MPTSTYRCENVDCPHRGADRVVPAVEVGDGLHAHPANVTCSCGAQPRRVDRGHSEAPRAPERAVKQQPEKRGRRG